MVRKYSNTLEIWGGIECSFNRIRSKYFDQLEFAGHYRRLEKDISMFAGLGLTAMRYPVVWERLQPRLDTSITWQATDVALNALRASNITPIAGLVHHGSGPKYADLNSAVFADGLKNFARSVAERYPWLEFYTPVNEPLTTARFCALYGLWYPHKRNDKTFVRVFLNEMRGVVLAMQEIRKINPAAKLVQTEDLAKIFSTPFMRYQAVFENHRRWLTFDILTGRLDSKHPMWSYFRHYAESESDLYFFLDNPCPPDIIGLDYYATSERYLDERLDRYPCEKHGHNHRHSYADVEAIRVRHDQPSGIYVLLKEVWERYRIPMAVTECHINCDYDNQIRWLAEIRSNCMRLQDEGVDLIAVTTWALLGSFGWNTLLTVPNGDYESGAFDISGHSPARTPLGDFVEAISRDPEFIHPATMEPGWWHEEDRFLFEPNSPAEMAERNNPELVEKCIEQQTQTY